MPAEEIAEVFLEVIEGGKSVSEGAKIIQFVADNGSAIAEGVTETAAAGNGIAAEVTAVTETASATGATTTTGLGLLAVDVGVAGAAIAPALGIIAGVGLYNLAPEFWTKVSNTLVEAGQTIGGKVHALLTNDGRVAYSEDTIEIFKSAFMEAGLFETSTQVDQLPEFGPIANPAPTPWYLSNAPVRIYDSTESTRYYEFYDFDGCACIVVYIPAYPGSSTWRHHLIFATDSPGAVIHFKNNSGNYSSDVSREYTYDNKTVYFTSNSNPWDALVGGSVNTWTYEQGVNNAAIAWYVIYGILKRIGVVQDGATVPTEVPFPQTYPDWEPIPVPESLPQPNYYPVEIPTQLPDQEQAQDPQPLPETDPDPWVRWIIENLPIPDPNPDPYPEPGPAPQPDPDPQPDPEPAPEPDPEPAEPNPPDPNEPVEPDPIPFIPPVLDTVDSTKIFTVYNPTSAELDALGAYLWSNDVLETIVKIWENPLDGVISLRQVYCTPAASGSHNIILGSLDSGVSAAVVTSQFTTIDCGSVTIGEKNKNVTDYSPYATVHLYLPFIGIVQLDVDEVMNSTLNVKYTIDVYTGTCLAEVYVTRSPDMTVSKILYTFSGNCSQTLPLTASDATGLASTLASLGAAAIGIVAGGGALGAVAGASMVGHSLTHEMINIGHSGSLSSNAGIMGQRKPYVIIGRRHGYDANSYNEIYGYPTNKTVFLSNCTGYVRVKAINLQSAATEEEKKEIIQLLKQGVIM